MRVLVVVAVLAARGWGEAGHLARVVAKKEEMAVLNSAWVGAEKKWSVYKRVFGKSYASAEAEAAAMAAFVENDATIVRHNGESSSPYTLGHNAFSDMTWEEFRRQRVGGFRARARTAAVVAAETGGEAPPESIDWVALGAVTGVKDQGSCGSCWAFSTTGALEGAYFVSNGTLLSLSEQMLVDCDTTDDGCAGGLMDDAFGWIETDGGICSEASYSYVGVDGSCEASCAKAVTLSGFVDVASGDEDALKAAVAMQPVSVAIEADQAVFQLYASGVLDSTACGTTLDHGVLVVGYGTTTNATDYWYVKNSWGTSWGMDGYLMMARGENMCGIAEEPSYPVGAAAAADAADDDSDDSHYSDPYEGGCLDDETEIQIEGVSGEACAPSCSVFSSCPTDVPDGVTGTPECALQDVLSGAMYCAIICSADRLGDDQCGDNASCKSISGVGICTYDA